MNERCAESTRNSASWDDAMMAIGDALVGRDVRGAGLDGGWGSRAHCAVLRGICARAWNGALRATWPCGALRHVVRTQLLFIVSDSAGEPSAFYSVLQIRTACMANERMDSWSVGDRCVGSIFLVETVLNSADMALALRRPKMHARGGRR
ncbi:hypothetical protein FGB62_65g013 [Gracilaria domingensis]|nr:hypothetical protein FGB62_65g013 [Gracilaria domingensis]